MKTLHNRHYPKPVLETVFDRVTKLSHAYILKKQDTPPFIIKYFKALPNINDFLCKYPVLTKDDLDRYFLNCPVSPTDKTETSMTF